MRRYHAKQQRMQRFQGAIMSDSLKHNIVMEYLDVISMRGTPDVLAIDCSLKRRCASPARPWPFENARDAALCFQEALDANRKKYAGVVVNVNLQRNLLALRKES